MMLKGVRRRRHGLRLAIAVAAVSAPLAAVLVGSGTSLAAGGIFAGYGPGAALSCGGQSYCWSPTSHSVNVGDTVGWTSAMGTHGLERLGTNWPASCSDGSASCVFTVAGTYNFDCIYHHGLMTGSVTVTGSQPPPPPPTTPPTSAPAPQPTQSHTAPPAYQPPASAAPPPSPSPVPSPSPSDTSQALAGPSSSSSPGSGSLGLASHPASSGGGPGVVLVIFVAVVLLGGAGAAVYFVRIRNA